MQLKKFGIYGVLLYGALYVSGLFLEISSAEKNYRSMTETIQLAAESAVQQALYGAEFDYPVCIDESSLKAIEDAKGFDGSNIVSVTDRVFISEFIRTGFPTYVNANQIPVISPVAEFNNSNFGRVFDILKESKTGNALSRTDSRVSFALATKDLTTRPKLVSAEPYSALNISNIFDNSVLTRLNSAVFNYDSTLFNYFYSDNENWHRVAEISGYIHSDVTYPVFNGVGFENKTFYKPNVFDMGLYSMHSFAGSPLTSLQISDGLSVLISPTNAVFFNSALKAMTDYKTNLTPLNDLFIEPLCDDMTNAYANHGTFRVNAISVPDLTGAPSLKYFTVNTPTTCGITYMDREMLQQLFVDNMHKLMTGKTLSVDNIGYVTDEMNHDVSLLLDADSYSDLQPFEKARFEETIKYGIINNGYFNFISGKLRSFNSALYNGGTGKQYYYLCEYAESPEYASKGGGAGSGTLKPNLPTVEYKTIKIADSANEELLKLVYQSDTALDLAKTLYPSKSLIIAKVTFFVDASVSYTNPFARDAVFVGSHQWNQGAPIGLISDAPANSDFHYMSHDALNDSTVYEDQASIRNLHKFEFTDSVPANVRYSPVTGNVLYEYTTYVAVVN